MEAHILPIKHLLDKLSNEAVLRLASSPSYNDIIKPRSVRWNSKRRLKKSRKMSALERHTMNFEARHGDISNIEKLRPFSVSPTWEPPTTIIAGTKKDATQLAKESINAGHTMIYTDGSGINKKIGTAAVHPASKEVRRMYMGNSEWYTVYSAELCGIVIALEMVQALGGLVQKDRKVIINTDNQASIQAIEDPRTHSGQAFVIAVTKWISVLRRGGYTVELHWIPAHIGLEGNEMADREAKEATGWRQREVHGRTTEIDTDETALQLRNYRRIISTVKTAIKAYALQQWAKEWKEETKGHVLRAIFPTPSHRITRIHKAVKRAKSSLITQIRTEKIGLKAFLYSRFVLGVDEESCTCGARRQTARHILHECRLLGRQRREWWANERRKAEGGVISHVDMLNNPRYITMAADFIKSTGLIGQYQALDVDQQHGFSRANGQKTGQGVDEEAPAL